MTTHSYAVYGLSVRSDVPLALASNGSTTLGAVSLSAGSPIEFDQARRATGIDLRTSRNRWTVLADGATYVVRAGIGEFIVSRSGWDVRYRRSADSPVEAFTSDVLGHVLAFSLMKRGLEPVHATVVEKDGRALALVGDGGAGKSTLGSAMLAEGFRLLTDDVLVTSIMDGSAFAYPGPPRLKVAAAGAATGGIGESRQMHMVSLPAAHRCGAVIPLSGIYQLATPDGALSRAEISVWRLTHHDAVAALVGAAFSRDGSAAMPSARQVNALAALASCVTVKRLSYPRLLSRLPDTVRALQADATAFRPSAGRSLGVSVGAY